MEKRVGLKGVALLCLLPPLAGCVQASGRMEKADGTSVEFALTRFMANTSVSVGEGGLTYSSQPDAALAARALDLANRLAGERHLAPSIEPVPERLSSREPPMLLPTYMNIRRDIGS